MKKLNYNLLAFIAIALLFASCGKNGAVGPAGANGKNGSVIYSGTTNPTASIGAIGDFYINLSTDSLFGPKTASGWGAAVNLKGADGNANVKVDTFHVGGSQWIYNSQFNYTTNLGTPTLYYTRYYKRANNSVTQDVLDNGMVLVYFTPSNANLWVPLPFQSYVITDPSAQQVYPYPINYIYVTSAGEVTLMYYFSDDTNAAGGYIDLQNYSDVTREYKIVTVSGQAGNFMLSHNVKQVGLK